MTEFSVKKLAIILIVLMVTAVSAISYPANGSSNRKSEGVTANIHFIPRHGKAANAGAQILPAGSGPFPVGVADYGINKASIPYRYNTLSFEGSANFTIFSAGKFTNNNGYSGTGAFTLQLNTILTNVSVGGINNMVYWTQNVLYLGNTTINRQNYATITLLDNIWNMSSQSAQMYNSSIYSANGTVSSYQGESYYWYEGPSYYATFPFAVDLYLTTSMVNGRSTVWFNYTLNAANILNYTTNQSVGSSSIHGSFDRVIFNSAVHSKIPSFLVNGFKLNHFGTDYDAEFVICGPGGGSTVAMQKTEGYLDLFYYSSRFKSYLTVPNSYDAGYDTAETATNITMQKGTLSGYIPDATMVTGADVALTYIWTPALSCSNPVETGSYIDITGTIFPSLSAINVTAISAGMIEQSTVLSGSDGLFYVYMLVEAGSIRIFVNYTVNGSVLISENFIYISNAGVVRGSVTPSDANLVLGQQSVAVSNGTFYIAVEAGKYYLNATCYGYIPFSEIVNVTANSTAYVNITLQFNMGWITGTINPSSANVTVNGIPVKTLYGVYNVSEPYGNYTVNASSAGYYSRTVNMRVYPGKDTILNISLDEKVGWINGTVTPLNSILEINNAIQQVNDTGFNVTLAAGLYAITVVHSGYYRFYEQVLLTAGSVIYLHVALNRTVGWLKINVNPENANIYLNGTYAELFNGTANITVTPRIYTVNASLNGYSSYHGVVDITAGHTIVLNITLTSSVAMSRLNGYDSFYLLLTAIVVIALVAGLMVRKRKMVIQQK